MVIGMTDMAWYVWTEYRHYRAIRLRIRCDKFPRSCAIAAQAAAGRHAHGGFKICIPLRKRCCDAGRVISDSDGVDQNVIEQIESLRPAIKREWGALLRAEPTLSPLGHPDTLTYLMDETISQVIKGVHGHSLKTWLRRSPALLAPLQRHCQCGLNPLLNYYATGELALRASFRHKFNAEICEALLTIYHIKAQQEIETLCAVCQVRGSTGCRSKRANAAAV